MSRGMPRGMSRVMSPARRSSPAYALALVFVPLMALLARLTLPPMAPFHENQHGYLMLTDVSTTREHLLFGVFTIYPALLNLLGLVWRGVLAFNVFLTSLTALGIMLLARELFIRHPAREAIAGFAGGFAALTPLAVRLGPTEVFFNTGAFLLVFGAWSGLVGLRKQRLAPLAAGALLVIMACFVRVLTVIYAPVALLLWMTALRRPLRIRALVLMALPMLAALGHGIETLFAAESVDTTTTTLVTAPLYNDLDGLLGMARHPSIATGFGIGAAVAGLVLLLVHGPLRGVGLALLISLLLMHTTGASVPETPSTYRHLLAATVLWALPAGAALAAPGHVAGHTTRRWLPVTLTALAALAIPIGFSPGLPFVVHRHPDNVQFEFVEACAARLPERACLLEYEAEGLSMSLYLGLSGLRPGWSVVPLEALPACREGVPTGAKPLPVISLVDLTCSSFRVPEQLSGGDPPSQTRYGPLNGSCARVINSHRWREVLHAEIPGASYMHYHVKPWRDRVPLACLIYEGD
jgi:hypothetical protein